MINREIEIVLDDIESRTMRMAEKILENAVEELEISLASISLASLDESFTEFEDRITEKIYDIIDDRLTKLLDDIKEICEHS